MNSKFFITRPILSVSLSVLITLIGVIGLLHLPIEQFPDVAPPVVNIDTDYTGASAEAVQKSVIVPIEEAVNGVDGMEHIFSQATSDGEGTTSITFRKGTDPDMAAVMVKNLVSEAEGLLPPEVVQNGVRVTKEQPGVLKFIALESPDGRYDNDFITNYFDIVVAPRLKRIKGVGQIDQLGSEYALRIWMDPKKMAQFELLPKDIEEALNMQNVEAAIGTLGENSDNTFQQMLIYRGRLVEMEEFENIVLKTTKKGTVLRLKDVARVELGTKSYTTFNQVNLHNGTIAQILRVNGQNAMQVNKEIDALLEKLKKDLPPGLELVVLLDTNDFLDASMKEVVKTLLETILLVILVVLIFLHKWRATFIPAIAIFVSLAGAFTFMYIIGFTLNLITLFALVLAIGTIVDDAIVVVEAVQTEIERGESSSRNATVTAMGKVGKAILSTTAVFMCVFIPASFIGGLSGTYYQQFGLTVAAAVGVSALVALTLTPALCALLMGADKKPGRFARSFTAFLHTLTEKYSLALQPLVRRKLLTVVAAVSAILLLLLMIHTMPTGLVPDEDTGNLFVEVTTPPGSTLEQTKKSVASVMEAISDIEEIEASASSSGFSNLGSNGANVALIIVKLKNWDDRKGTDINDVIDRIAYKTRNIKSANLVTYAMPTVPGFSNGSGIELQVESYGGDVVKLNEITEQFAEKLRQCKGIEDVYKQYDVNFPQYTVSINAALCQFHGIEPAIVLDVLNGYIGGDLVSHFNLFGKMYHVMLQANPVLRANVEDLDNIHVVTKNGGYTPVTSLITLKKRQGVQSLNRFNLSQSIPLEINPVEGYSTGKVIETIEQVANKTLPVGYGYEYTGMTREEISSSDNMSMVIILCVIFAFIVLSSLYESVMLPLAVLLSVPFGLAGSFLVATIAGIDNNIYMQLGVIMLIGLLSKTAILLTEYASERRQEGMSIVDAALSAARVRLRPILMTALTMIVGLLPLVFASGAGAVGNRSLGICVIAGMTVGTVCLLLFVPVLFIIFQSLEEKLHTRFSSSAATILLLLAGAVGLSGCRTYRGYQEQAVELDSIVRNDLTINDVGDDSWQTLFDEPLLKPLIAEGLEHNSDIRTARLQVEAAKAQLRAAKGDLLPKLKLNGNFSPKRFDNSDISLTETSHTVDAEVSWEVDIFGKMQNARRAAAATVEEKAAYAKAVRTELITTIVTAYYKLEMLDAQIATTSRTIESWEAMVRTQKALVAVGEATSDELSQTEASQLKTKAELEELRRDMLQAENALCAVLGRKSGHIERGDFATSCLSMKAIPRINIRALRKRPDILMAEAQLKSAYYTTNVAIASLYPSLNLSGSIGWTNDPGTVMNPTGWLKSAMASLTAPIFEGGRLRAEVKKAQAEQESAKIAFQQAVIDAGKEVNDALASEQYARKTISLRELEIEKLSHTLHATRLKMRYDSGVNYLQVLTAQQSLLEAEINLLSDRYTMLESCIQLFRALGGEYTRSSENPAS